ncbi:MAG: hypothetical protein PUD93_12300, partial [Lachnospiraceae bacterium]|nr:hypothetical protein [Lachnospiraceae bacterium]
MNSLISLHNKVKYHRYRENIVLNSRHYKKYVETFHDMLDGFQKEILTAKQIEPSARSLGQNMIIELEHRCFLVDARRKLNALLLYGQAYQDSGSPETEQQIRILMAQLEGTLSTIHEYIAFGVVHFFIRYATDTTLEQTRLVWRGTDYVELQP